MLANESGGKQIKGIVVFRRGLLGDILVSVPALACLRDAYPEALIWLVTEKSWRNEFCWGTEILGNSGLIDEVVQFSGYNSMSLFHKLTAVISLIWKSRWFSWDIGICLDLGDRVTWEPVLARMMRCKHVVMPSRGPYLRRSESGVLIDAPSVSDELTKILVQLGIQVPQAGHLSFDLRINSRERDHLSHWIQSSGLARYPRPWYAITPWSNMPAKKWPLERFHEIANRIKSSFGGTPLLFGGARENPEAEAFVRTLGYGFAIAGRLNVRESFELLKDCALFVGNDTGTMHMAAFAGVPCVAIFSARDSPGRWFPYGQGHAVLRRQMDCEGCMLRECSIRQNRCLLDIGIDEVYECCARLLRAQMNSR